MRKGGGGRRGGFEEVVESRAWMEGASGRMRARLDGSQSLNREIFLGGVQTEFRGRDKIWRKKGCVS